MAQLDPIEQLWQTLYSAIEGQATNRTFTSYHALPDRFDQELLNDVAALKPLKGSELEPAKDALHAKFEIAASVELIGQKDVQQLHNLLDKIS